MEALALVLCALVVKGGDGGGGDAGAGDGDGGSGGGGSGTEAATSPLNKLWTTWVTTCVVFVPATTSSPMT